MQDETPTEPMTEGDAETTATNAEVPARADRSRWIGLGAMGTFVAIGLLALAFSPRAPAPAPAAQADDAAAPAVALAISAAVPAAPEAPPPRPPPPWRVASLKSDPNLELVEGTFGKKGMVATLTEAGLSRAEVKRLARAFDGNRHFERPTTSDAFLFAKDKANGAVLAFELTTSPMDVWQVRFEEGGASTAKKLDLFVEHKRVASALVIGADLAKALAAANLRPEVVDAVDDALEGHVEPGTLRAGARLRVVSTEDWVDGQFVRTRLDAVELVPPAAKASIRVYHYEREPGSGSHRHAPAAGFYDAKGRQPYRGAFRPPLLLARVTSRFNPKRLHPVLKVVMPHNGVDYGASTGTPVYASAAGTVMTAGNGGPCGNMVEIAHAGGVTTVYCHLKGFAAGLHSGQKVEARQLVGYVGQTGRVTGPHLHFGVKRNGMFVDPLGLKMDGVRVLPPSDREAFQHRRAELDGVLDGVPLPAAVEVPEENDDDKELHGE